MKQQLIIESMDFFISVSQKEKYQTIFSLLNFEISKPKIYITGRIPTNDECFICAFIVKQLEKLPTIRHLYNFLDCNLYIAYLCGFNIIRGLPCYETFCRRLKYIDNNSIKHIYFNVVTKLINLGIIDTQFLAIDSTKIFANTSLNNKNVSRKSKFNKSPTSDSDCKLSAYSNSNEDNSKPTYYWGYKNHIICDTISGLPLYEITTPANVHDSKPVIPMLQTLNSVVSLRECYFIADKGYDCSNIHQFVHNKLKGTAFIPLRKFNSKRSTKLTITNEANKNPICEAGLKMVSGGSQYLKTKVKKKYRCPYATSSINQCPIHHEKFNTNNKYKGCTCYVSTDADTAYRKKIDRNSTLFKKVYSLRTEIERHNSRIKNMFVEKPFVRNLNSIANLNSLSNLTCLIWAFAAISNGKISNIRSLNVA